MDNFPRKSFRLKAGKISSLHEVEDRIPPPGPGEVGVSVKAIGLNFADLFAVWGLYGATPEGEFTPGLEFSGEVTAVGEGVNDYKPGDRVMGATRFGAYTSRINIDRRYINHLPQGWDFEHGAAFLVQVLTAYYALRTLGDLQRGQNVLIHSAAGGVGVWAIRIAKHFGAFTIGTVGSAGKLDVLEKEGCDRGIVRSPNFAKDLAQALDRRPLHIVLDSIGGRIWRESFDAMAPQGRCIVYGSARYASPTDRPNYFRLIYHYLTRPRLDPQKLIEQNKSVMGFNLIWLFHQVDQMRGLLDEILALGLEAPLVGESYPFEQLPEALRRLQSGQTVGKVVVTIN